MLRKHIYLYHEKTPEDFITALVRLQEACGVDDLKKIC